MSNNLLILGAGEYGMVVKETAEAMKIYDKIDFLDDNSAIAIGKLSDYRQLINRYHSVFVAIGNSATRLEWIKRLEEASCQISVLVNPTAWISPSARIGKGSILEANAVVNTKTTISIGCIVSAGAIVHHNSILGEGCHLNCGAIVKSNTVVPSGTTLESGAVFGLNIPKKCPDNYDFYVGV